MHRRKGTGACLLLLPLALLLVGCGGGGGSDAPAESTVAPPPGSLSVLEWNPPANYADNTALDPFQDLDHYEVYVRDDAQFTDADLPVAVIAAVADAPASSGNTGGKVLDKEFILNNIEPFISPGATHYVSLKAVGVDGQKSDFMPAVLWNNS
jgi:hypothetical protein